MSRNEMTIAEAEAWEAARDACIEQAQALMRELDAAGNLCAGDIMFLLADRLRALRPSVPNGLESRG